MYDRNLTDDELALLKESGADRDFIKYVDVFPRSTPGQTVIGWFEQPEITDEMVAAGKVFSGGSFFDALWVGDFTKARRMADSKNSQHMETLFDGQEHTGVQNLL